MKNILIDLETIRRNNKYGFAEYVVGEVAWLFTYIYDKKNTHEFLKSNGVYITAEFSSSEHDNVTAHGEIGHKHLFDDLKQQVLDKKIEGLTLEENISMIEMRSNEPKWLYEYHNPKLECDNCKKPVKVKELIERLDEEGFLSYECPYCGEIDCVDIIFESIDDALTRKQEQTWNRRKE